MVEKEMLEKYESLNAHSWNGKLSKRFYGRDGKPSKRCRLLQAEEKALLSKLEAPDPSIFTRGCAIVYLQ